MGEEREGVGGEIVEVKGAWGKGAGGEGQEQEEKVHESKGQGQREKLVEGDKVQSKNNM